MTLAKKYTFGLYDRDNRHVTAEIYREGYTGAAEAVATIGKPAIVINKGGASDYVLDPVKGSTAAIRLHKTSILQYLDFFSSDFKNSRLDILIDTVLFWRGWCLPDVYSEPLLSKTVTLNFTDGLSLLSGMDFELSGSQNLFDIITYILGLIDLEIGLNSGCSIREDSISTTTSVEPLAQIDFDADQFAGKKCRYVLDQVLEKHGLRIFQEWGVWVVEQIGDKTSGEIIRKYNNLFVYQSVEAQNNVLTLPVTSGALVSFLAGGAAIEMIPGWKSFKLTDEFGRRVSIIKNSDFSNYVINTVGAVISKADFVNWTNTVDSFIVFLNEVAYNAIPVIQESNYANYVTADAVINIIQPTLAANSAQRLRITFDFFPFHYFPAPGFATNFIFYVRIKLGSYYLDGAGNWTVTETLIEVGTLTMTHFRLGVNKSEFTIESDEILAGDLEISFFRPLYSEAGTCWIGVGNVKAVLLDGNAKSYDQKLAETIIINSNNNYESANKTFEICDLPDFVNNKHMFLNGMLTGGAVTDNWNYKGMAGTLSELFIYQIVHNYAKLKAKITGAGFYGYGAGMNKVFIISGLTNRRFMLVGYSHDLYRSTIEGAELVELPYLPQESAAAAYFYAQFGDSLLNLKGLNATVAGAYIIFPNVANDIFNKENVTFWQAGLTIHDTDPRKWAFSELLGTAVILYSTATCRARLFFRDYAGNLDSILPIMAFSTDRSAAEQQTIVDYLNEYFFILDNTGAVVKDIGDDYLTTD